MAISTAIAQPMPDMEPIPGYILRKKIGSGGYGEVWIADAPGGLKKAIKFVFGSLDDDRAAREWKSLNRIKQVHHPFLLSLERIEIVAARLVIVTELADFSLLDRFGQCRAQGLEGIPQQELLAYLSDAADALDYLYTQHGLQHLDVKPENLLVLGHHIKIADFGLTKDLTEPGLSLMGGLTPAYAPPEVFDGRPNRHSDQYSLAIVFQTMRTGCPPFNGRTTAQLAAQHLHSPPDVSSLSKGEQRVIRQALAKDPCRRFPSCRQMVEALQGAGAAGPPRGPAPSGRPVTFGLTTSAPAGQEVAGSRPGPPAGIQPITADSIDLGTAALAMKPTLIIGVGGTAAHVLTRLHTRLADQWRDVRQVPSLQILLIDTDPHSSSTAARDPAARPLNDSQLLYVPLRSAHHYRTQAAGLLNWLSRRWLYNIPRSLRTEGIRPLGRLALVDHHEQVRQQLQSCLTTAMDRVSRQTSEVSTGWNWDEPGATIVLVGSICGGTAGGMLLDLAYMIRAILMEWELPDEGLIGILLRSAPRGSVERELAIANAYALLSELGHYSSPGHFYPGDSTCGIPPFPNRSPTFHHTYLVELGDELNDAQYQQAAYQVADALHRMLVAPSRCFFQELWRREAQTVGNSLTYRQVRSLGTATLSDIQTEVECLAGKLGSQLLSAWSGSPTSRGPENSATACVQERGWPLGIAESELGAIDGACATFASSLVLSTDQWLRRLTLMLHDMLDGNPADYVRRLVQTKRHALAGALAHMGGLDPASNCSESLFTELDAQSGHPGELAALANALHGRCEPLMKETAEVIGEWLMQLVNVPNGWLNAARRGIIWFHHHLQHELEVAAERRDECHARQDTLRQELAKLTPAALADPRALDRGRPVEDKLCDYVHAELNRVMVREAYRILLYCQEHVAQEQDQVAHFEACLRSWCASLDKAGMALPELVPGQFGADLVRQVHHEVAQLCFREGQTLASMLAGNSRTQDALLSAVGEASRRVARRAWAQTVEQRTSSELVVTSSRLEPVAQTIQRSTPLLAHCGGCRRWLVCGPNLADTQQRIAEIKQRAQAPVTFVTDNANDLVLIQEIEQIPLDNVAAQLIGDHPEYADMARRLRTRIDVAWSFD